MVKPKDTRGFNWKLAMILLVISTLSFLAVFIYEFSFHTTFNYNNKKFYVDSFDELQMIMKSEDSIIELKNINRLEKENRLTQSFPLIGSFDIKHDNKNINVHNSTLGKSYIMTNSGQREIKKAYRINLDSNVDQLSDDMLLALRVEHVYGVRSGWWHLGLILGLFMITFWTYVYVQYYSLQHKSEEMTKRRKIVSWMIYFAISMVFILMNVSLISMYRYI